MASGDADNYGPVKRNETLWDIAKRIRPDSDISMQQMMLALQHANPDAFINNNINNLKAGVTLRVPQRNEILSLDQSAARREASRQYTEWQQGRGAEPPSKQAKAPEMAPEGQPASAPEPKTAPEAAHATESRLQLVAPEDEAIKGAVAPGAPASGAAQAPDSQALRQQLTLATEEAEAGRAQSQELQSRVGKLEEQVTSMQRLIELKDEQLANLQNRLAAQNQTPPANTADKTSSEAQAPASDEMAAPGETLARKTLAANGRNDAKPEGIVDRLLDNPVLAGLGVLVAMILGGFLWASTRHRKTEDIFNEEPTLANQMSAVRNDEPPVRPRVAVSDDTVFSDLSASDMGPLQGDDASDPLTEADVFIAYGRVQQAEDVIKSALHGNPDRRDLKIKLLEIYHAAGNTAAFDVQAAMFRETVGEDDPDWRSVADMGYELSPANPLYQAAITLRPVQEGDVEFGMNLYGMEERPTAGNPAGNDIGLDYEAGVKRSGDYAENVDFNLDALNLNQEEESLAEGLLESSDEIGTKLDLARAYMDMGDPDGARDILEEVLEEGNDDQKVEAETLISQLA
jgi:pilus assembly protein FimV